MRVERLELARFGHFTDHLIDFGPAPDRGEPDLHVVHGPNEAGKSTTLEALTDLLFGMPLRSPHDFVHDYASLELRARLVRADGTPLEVRRLKNALTDALGERLDAGVIDVHGLTREAFRARFSFDTAALEEGGEAMLASRGDLGEALFSASAGLPDVRARLAEAMADSDRFYEPRKVKDKLLPALVEEIRRIDARLDEVDVQAKAWRELKEGAATRKGEWEVREAAHAECDARLRAAERERAAFGSATRLVRARAALDGPDAAGDTDGPPPPPGWRSRLREIAPRHVSLGDAVERARTRRDALRAERDRIVPDPVPLEAAERIDALLVGRGAERERGERLASLDEEVAAARMRIEAARASLGVPSDTAPHAVLPTADRLQALERLARERAGLDEKLGHARSERDALEARRAALASEDARAEVETSDDASRTMSDPAPLASLLAHVRERADGAGVDRLERDAREARRALDAALAGLRPWSEGVDALEALAVPPPRARAELRGALVEARERTRRLDERADALAAERTELERRRASERGDESLDDARAAAVRADRDRAWQDHLGALDAPSPDSSSMRRTARDFARALAEDDALGAARLRASDRVARLRALDAGMAELASGADALERDRVAATDELAAARAAVAAVADALGLPPATEPDDIERWLDLRERALEALAEWRTADDDLEALRTRRAALGERLRAALGKGAFAGAVSEDAPLELWLGHADARLRTLADEAERRRAHIAERERVRADIAERAAASAAGERALADWAERWRTALGTSWLAEREAIDVVDALPRLRALERELDAQDSRLVERDRLGSAQRRHFTEVRAVLDATGERVPEGSDSDAAAREGLSALERRLATARRSTLERERLEEARRAADTEVEGLERERGPIVAEIADMFRHCRVDSIPALEHALERARERRDLKREAAGAQTELIEALGADSIDAALTRLSTLERGALDADVQRLERELATLAEEAAARRLAWRRAQDALEGVSGDAEAARLAERRANLVLEIRERAEQTLRMRLGREAVLEGVRRYRDAHRGALMTRARDAFVTLTRGRYADLQTRPDERGNDRLRAVTADGRSLEPSQLSDGTRFQLYLALRVAAYHEYAAHRTPLPFVADDVMESFDESRTEAALGLLREMARSGQVVYLTHHRHVVELAREITGGAVRVHALPEPA